MRRQTSFTLISAIPKLSSPNQPTSASTNTWSTRITERYQVRLSAELARWFDNELWKHEGNSEYREPIPPSDLIETFPEAIWPGLMPPDFLPVLGNMAGDWLCMRIGPMGEVAEIVQWYHGGGDWLPWGNRFAEAIVFDAISPWLPGPSRRHAIPAEPTRSTVQTDDDPLLNWALGELSSETATLVRDAIALRDSSQLSQSMLEIGIAEVALRCETIQCLLSHPDLHELQSDKSAPGRLGVSRHQINEWLFDAERIPTEYRDTVLKVNGTVNQNWDAASQHCRRIVSIAPHLAWGWDILGYCCLRSGSYLEAAQHFAAGLTRSVFTDQSVRLFTHWTHPKAAKFSAAMLLELLESGRVSVDQIEGEYDPVYLQALCASEATRQEQVMEYWLERSERSLLAGNHEVAFDEAYAAGWDLGAATLPAYGSVLDRLVRIAEAGGDAARAELARTHRRCLSDRLGV